MWARCQYSPRYRLGVIGLPLVYNLTSFLPPQPLLTPVLLSLTIPRPPLPPPPPFPLHPLPTRVFHFYAHKVICFSTGSRPRSVPGESIHWRDEKSRGPGRRITRPPLCPANLEVRRGGWSFKQSAPSFIIHATAVKIFFRQHHISSSPILRPAHLLLLLLTPHIVPHPLPPSPSLPRQSIHKV